jgi:hypothetical protein
VSKQGGESPEGRFAANAVSATRVLDLDWGDLYGFAEVAVGYSVLQEYVDAGAGHTVRYISRLLPMPYGALKGPGGRPFLWATDVPRWKALGRTTGPGLLDGVATYTKARAWIQFSTLTYELASDAECVPYAGSSSPLAPYGFPDEGLLKRFVTRLWRPAHRVQTLPLGVMKVIDASPKPIREPLPFNIPMAEIIYIHHGRPEVPYKAITAAVNTVNDADFDGGRFKAGTLLCETPDVRPYFSPLGIRIYDVHFRFRWRPNVDSGGTARGWNYAYLKKPSTGALDYWEVSSDGTGGGTRLFRTSDLTALFRPDWD